MKYQPAFRHLINFVRQTMRRDSKSKPSTFTFFQTKTLEILYGVCEYQYDGNLVLYQT